MTSESWKTEEGKQHSGSGSLEKAKRAWFTSKFCTGEGGREGGGWVVLVSSCLVGVDRSHI